VELKLYPSICAGVLLKAYTNRPVGSAISRLSLAKDANGDPGTAVNAAVELLIPKTEVLLEAEFATSRNFLVESNARESGDEPPVVKGEPVPG
jgi:hypothetical protein